MIEIHVAIADEDETASTALMDLLREAGYRVTAVGTGSAALARLEAAHREHPISLLIVDIAMPDLPGLDLLEAMGRSRNVRCPVMILSGDWDEETVTCVIRGPRLGFLAKPFTPAHLVSYLPWALQRRAFPTAPPMRGAAAAAR